MLIPNRQVEISTIQMKLPLEIGVKIEKDDPVVSFKEVMEGVELRKYLKRSEQDPRGREGYDPEVLFKIVLFAYMNNVRSTRKIADLCRNDIRFMYLSEEITPSHMTIANFINEHLKETIEDIFSEITKYIIEKQEIDISTVYIDGTKIEAFPNKYTWVWKKACITSRDRKFKYLREFFTKLNNEVMYIGQPEFPTEESYSIETLEGIIQELKEAMERLGITERAGRGHKKKKIQRAYGELTKITEKLKEYAEKIAVCGEERNSYAKTDRDATFMRMKTDYMGNTALLPAYNWQLATAGEVIVCGLTSQSAADSRCFIPMMEKYHKTYGKYPEKAVGDAGYGTMETYLYCERHGIGKYLKYTSWQRETHDKEFHKDPFRSRNFKTDEEGHPICPNGKKFIKMFDRQIRGNADHRTEEIYECEDCSGCPFREKCHKSEKNRRININRTLTSYHEEVIRNLASEEGIYHRQIRSSMAEGTFGVIKADYKFNRLTRVSLKKVNMEFHLIMIGYNLAKYHNLKCRKKRTELS